MKSGVDPSAGRNGYLSGRRDADLKPELMEGRSVSKINGETVTMGVLRDVASLLIDIHEQHEHQRLLNKRNHLTFLDVYAKEQVEKPKQKDGPGLPGISGVQPQAGSIWNGREGAAQRD